MWHNPLPWILALAALTGPLAALTLELPAPVLNQGSRVEVPGSYPLPLAVFDGTSVPVRQTEGAVDQRAYQLDAPGQTTLAILQPLRQQITDAGFEIIFECEDRACGGFDFRYGTDILPEPDMHVDLADFRFLSAVQGEEAISVLVSRSPLSAYVQITRVSKAPAAEVPTTDAVETPVIEMTPELPEPVAAAGPEGAVLAGLEGVGKAVLDDLVFASGAASLAEGDYASLQAVAAWLDANPDGTVALVGHTDASGSLAANIALSERRAEAVAEVLVTRFGVDRSRIAAEGVGFLAPIATNQTEEGRQKNRRVEVVVTSTR